MADDKTRAGEAFAATNPARTRKRRRQLQRAIDKLEGELLTVSRESTRLVKREKVAALRVELDGLPDDDDEADPDYEVKQSELLVRLAGEHFEVFEPIGEGGSAALAVARNGPNVAIRVKGDSRGLRQRLAAMYRRQYGTPPGQSALAEALAVIEGDVIDTQPRQVYRRVARLAECSIVLDLGDAEGRCVLVNGSGWKLLDRSPVPFIRERKLTRALPVPRRRGSLRGLRRLVNVSQADWRVSVAWMVHALIPDQAHTILAVHGEHGAAKTASAEALMWTIDLSDGTTRSAPANGKDWAVAASASWTFIVDNLSFIEPWLSDMMCKAVTGEAHVYRALYTDADTSVLQVQRAFAFTTIGTNPLRGDLADRLLPITCPMIPAAKLRTDAEIADAFRRCHASALGAVLDLLAAVLARLPAVKVEQPTRMADFCKVCLALGHTLTPDQPTAILDHYRTLHEQEMDDVLDSDPVGQALLRLLRDRGGEWEGTASDLLSLLNMLTPTPPQGWPRTPHRLSNLLRRLVPSLRRRAIAIDFEHSGDRKITIHQISDKGETASTASKRPTGSGGEVAGQGLADLDAVDADSSYSLIPGERNFPQQASPDGEARERVITRQPAARQRRKPVARLVEGGV